MLRVEHQRAVVNLICTLGIQVGHPGERPSEGGEEEGALNCRGAIGGYTDRGKGAWLIWSSGKVEVWSCFACIREGWH